jgi:serine/threonine protein kinase
MLTGRHPFEGDSATAVMLKIVNDAPRRIDGNDLPAALKGAVARALEKSPAARYARAADLGRDLKSVKATMPNPRDTATVVIDRSKLELPPKPSPRAPAAPQPKLAEPPRRRERWPIFVVVSVVVAIAAIAVYVLSRG